MNTSNNLLAHEQKVSIEVIYVEGTVWLSQLQLAKLFRVTSDAINVHLKNIFGEGDLSPENTSKVFLVSKVEGGRTLQRRIKHYNLEMFHEISRRCQKRVFLESVEELWNKQKATFTVTIREQQQYPSTGIVYFIQALEGGLIKIGKARDVAGRFRNIQNMCPIPLKILATVSGYHATETELHKMFAHLRAYGEWFHPAPELLDYITENGLPYESE